MSWILVVIIIVLIAGLAYGVYHSRWIATADLEINEKTVYLPRLPAELEGLRVLHLSDFHLVPKDERDQSFFNALYDLQADITFLTGDFVEKPDTVDLVKPHIPLFHRDFGMFGVLGNHDYFDSGFKDLIMQRRRPDNTMAVNKLVGTLTEFGVEVLRNAHTRVTIRGVEVVIAGTEDPYTQQHDVHATLQGVEDDDFVIMLTHSADSMHPSNGFWHADLVLGGHTHGGQVRIPGIGPLVNGTHLGRDWVSGLFGCEEKVVHISRGLGVSHDFPFRTFCRPEATVLVLQRGEPDLTEARWLDNSFFPMYHKFRQKRINRLWESADKE